MSRPMRCVAAARAQGWDFVTAMPPSSLKANLAVGPRKSSDGTQRLDHLEGRWAVRVAALQVMVTGEMARSWSVVRAYAEPVSATNPFEAEVSSGTDAMNSAKLRMQWTHHFGQGIDAIL